MVFKFVRFDSSESCKVVLPVGKHIIGRGKFLVDNTVENKVSRNHAELEVTADSVTVTSLHINPCFLIKKNTKETQVISQNTTVTLSNGDKFGILPQIYWYELIYCPEEDNHIHNIMEQEENKTEEQVDTDVDIDGIKEEEVLINFEMNETNDNGLSQDSPSLLKSQSSTQDYNLESPHLHAAHDQGDGTKSPVKRPHNSQGSSQNDESKRTKTETEESDTTKAGPSNEQELSPIMKVEPPQSAVQPPNNVDLRERCMYGANCYRKNTQHKVQFSHPRDADWEDNRRQCQFGASCRRRDPRHWRDYLHPPGVNPPNPNGPGMQVVERRGNTFYINAHTVHFHDDHFQVEDSDGDSVDYDYEF